MLGKLSYAQSGSSDIESLAGLMRFLNPPPPSLTKIYDTNLPLAERVQHAKEGGWSVHYKRARGKGQRNRILGATLWHPETNERITI